MPGGDVSMEELRAQNKFLKQRVKQLELSLCIEQEKSRTADEKICRLKTCHDEEVSRLKSCHDEEVSRLKKAHDEELRFESTLNKDLLANIVNKIRGSAKSSSTINYHATAFTDGDTGSSCDLIDLLKETILNPDMDSQALHQSEKHDPGDSSTRISQQATPDPQIIKQKELLPLSMWAPHISCHNAAQASRSWGSAPPPPGLSRPEEDCRIDIEEHGAEEVGTDIHSQGTLRASSECSGTSDLSKALEPGTRLVKDQLKAQRLLFDVVGITFEYLSQGIDYVKSLSASDETLELVKNAFYKHFGIPGDLLVQRLDEMNKKANSVKHPKDKLSDIPEIKETTYLQWLLGFIDEKGGCILSQDVDRLYLRHPEIREAIGYGRLRQFCGKHDELVYEHSGEDGVAATIRRRVDPQEAICLQWMLDFIDEHGGSVASQDMSLLYSHHPALKEVVGNGKLRKFCERHPELMYKSSGKRSIPSTICRRNSSESTSSDDYKFQ
jgi:hypothetical protein